MSAGLRYSEETSELSDHCNEIPEKQSPALKLVRVVVQPDGVVANCPTCTMT